MILGSGTGASWPRAIGVLPLTNYSVCLSTEFSQLIKAEHFSETVEIRFVPLSFCFYKHYGAEWHAL